MNCDSSASGDHTFNLRYYDLERYLFEEVNPKFRRLGFLKAFDLFSIVIWKSNRSKSYFACRLLKVAEKRGLECDLDGLAQRLTSDLSGADTSERRFTILFDEWDITLPIASAILCVLFPNDFTVYDRRVCDQVGAFHNLVNKSSVKNLWSEYQRFIETVKAIDPKDFELRDKDRYLFGKSVADQLKENIERAFLTKD